MTVPSSLVVMVPSPSLSKREKASLNSAICSSVKESAILEYNKLNYDYKECVEQQVWQFQIYTQLGNANLEGTIVNPRFIICTII